MLKLYRMVVAYKTEVRNSVSRRAKCSTDLSLQVGKSFAGFAILAWWLNALMH